MGLILVTPVPSPDCGEGCKAAELGGEGFSSLFSPSLLRLHDEGSAGNGLLGDKGRGGAWLGGQVSRQACLARSRRNISRNSFMMSSSWRHWWYTR